MAAGDTVHVDLEPAAPTEEPAAEPEPTTSPELEDALATDPALATAWQSLPETHRTEYGRWISTAADAETRRARIARMRHRRLGG